tara:strand:- start:959 stop:1582 length:624 start_codon:yes stop_codon:yes gene_type:complete
MVEQAKKVNSIRSQMESNEFMDERSVEMGESAEKKFDRAVKAQGKSVRKASRYEERVQHIDRWIGDKRWWPKLNQTMKDKPEISVEIKAMKRISRASSKPQSEWLWVEFRNVSGGLGWLYGDAILLATEVETGFYLLYLKSLRSWAEFKVDRDAKVANPNHAQYTSYSRKNRKDEMSLINLQEFIDWYEEASGTEVIFYPKVEISAQ